MDNWADENMNAVSKGVAIVCIGAVLTATVWYYAELSRPKKSWVLVEGCSWNGKMGELFTSTTFRIAAEKWKVAWSIDGSVINAYVHITIINAIAYGHPVVKDYYWTSQGAGEAELTQKGSFYLTVDARGAFRNWYVSVYEWK